MNRLSICVRFHACWTKTLFAFVVFISCYKIFNSFGSFGGWICVARCAGWFLSCLLSLSCRCTNCMRLHWFACMIIRISCEQFFSCVLNVFIPFVFALLFTRLNVLSSIVSDFFLLFVKEKKGLKKETKKHFAADAV